MKKPYYVPTIRLAIARSRTLVLTTHRYRRRQREYLDEVLGLCLEAVGRDDIRSQLSYCLHELASNAERANTKRAFFYDAGLDINDPDSYARGMGRFKEVVVGDLDRFLAIQRSLGLHVRFRFARSSEGLTVSVENNAPPTEFEWKRIRGKLEVAARTQAIPDVYNELEDSSEGAGLGIVMMTVMLRELGLPDSALSMERSDRSMIASLMVPGKQKQIRRNNGYQYAV